MISGCCSGQPVAKAVTKSADVDAMAQRLHAAHGRVDILVNNAGVARSDVRAEDTTGADTLAVRVTIDGQLLAETLDGKAVPIDPGEHVVRFELAGAHHDHLHCTNCDELIAVACVIDRQAYSAIETATGAAILDHHVVLSGLCPKCAASAR